MTLNVADAVYVGDVAVDRVYLGDMLVWEPSHGETVYDPDTQRYLDATGLDEFYAPALDGLVRGLKDAGLWAKMLAVYPFIGGTADFHKWNLIDPRDTDAAFRLTITGGTHSDDLGYRPNEQGAQISSPNHADTHLVPLGTMEQDSTHLAFYSLADVPPADRAEMGCFNWTGTSASRFHIIARYLGVNSFYYGMSEDGPNSNVGVPSADGLFVATRTGPVAQAGYHKGALVQANGVPSITLPHVPIWIGGINVFANKSDIPCGFASIGSGLDAQNVADLNALVTEYRLAVSNAHWTPKMVPGLVAWIDPAQDTFGDGQKIIEYREHANGEVFTTDGVNGPIFHGGGAPYIEWPATHVGFTSAQQRTFHDGATVISVCSVEGGSYPMMAVVGTDPNGMEMRHDGVSQQIVVMYTSYGIVFSHPTPSSRAKTLYAMRVEPGAATAAWTNDVQALGGAPASMLPEPQTLYIGRRQGGYYFVGPMYETLVYDGPVSDADLALLTDYLATKHNLYAI